MKRRTFIKDSALTALSISAFGAIQWNGKSYVGSNATTTDILGPFYRPGAPMRNNLITANSKGRPITLKGIIFRDDGKTPIPRALVEIWHCDENTHYDNDSDNYAFRGAWRTDSDGAYEFKTILPVPYLAVPTDETSWRPAHIHMRVSVPDQQDLITQIYFKGGKYIDTDRWSSSPQAMNRILDVTSNEVTFDVVMSKSFPLEEETYKRITGLYKIGDWNVEFIKNDDLLFMKWNGQLNAGLRYAGNNTFEGGIGNPKVTFELLPGGITRATFNYRDKTYTGERFLKYGD